VDPSGKCFKSADGGNNWQEFNGLLAHIAVSAGHVVGANSSQQLWHMKFFLEEEIKSFGGGGMGGGMSGGMSGGGMGGGQHQRGVWHQLPGQATSIGVDNNGNMVCVNSGQEIFEKASHSKEWRRIEGAATMIARGQDGTTWCVNREQNLYRWNGGGWTQMPGQAVFVAVGSAGEVVVINSSEQIYKWNGNDNWIKLDGQAVTASVGADGTLFVANSGGELYRRDGGSWTKVSGAGKLHAVCHRGLIFVVNAAGQIYRSTDAGGNWQGVEGALTHIAAAAGHLVGANAAQQLYHMHL